VATKIFPASAGIKPGAHWPSNNGQGKALSLERRQIGQFEEKVMVHLDAAYNLARWLTRDERDAEDVAQEALLRAFRFFDSFHGENGRAWLLAIVRNTYYTWLDKNRLQACNISLDEDTMASIESDTASPIDGIELLLQ
jgi:RNA polymerase sigma factor (sigma-70 family)